jgi:hypothetical protein
MCRADVDVVLPLTRNSSWGGLLALGCLTVVLLMRRLLMRVFSVELRSSLLPWAEVGPMKGPRSRWTGISRYPEHRQHPRVPFPSWRRHREAPFFLHSWSFVSGWKLCSSWGGRQQHVGAPRRRFRSWILDALLCTSESFHFLVARAPKDDISVILVKAVAWSSNPTYSSAARGRCFNPRTFHFFLCECLLFFFLYIGVVLFFSPVHHL